MPDINRLHTSVKTALFRLSLPGFSPSFYTGPLLLTVLAMPGISMAQAQSSQASRYHEMLLKRPQSGPVLERFIGAWLETETSQSLRAFLESRNGSAEDLLVLALFHEYEGRSSEALKAFGAALAKDPANSAAWLQKARLEARMLDFDAALKSLDRADTGKPDEVTAVESGKLRGRLLLRTGRTAEALKTWQNLLATRPTDEDLAEEVVELQLDEALYDEAAALTRNLTDKTSDASAKMERRLLLADILMRGGKQGEALKVYGDALGQAGQNTWIEREILAQTESFFRRGNDLSGLSTHLAALAKDHPQRVGLLQMQARIQAESGQGAVALASYHTLLQRTPGQRDLREAYLDLLTRQEKFAEAITQTRLLLEQNPTDAELHIRLAGLYQRQKDLPSLKAAIAAYLAMPQTGEYEHLRVARLFEGWELKAEALATYETLVKTLPESFSARDAQAHYLHRSGDREAALKIWQGLAQKTTSEDELLAVAQSLSSRLEPDAARQVLHHHLDAFGRSDRFLAALVNATLNARDADAPAEANLVKLRLERLAEAVPWVMERVLMAGDAGQIEEATRQATTLLAQAAAVKPTIELLRQRPHLKISERSLLAALQEMTGQQTEAEQTLLSAPLADAGPAQTQLVRLLEKRQDWQRAAIEAEKLIKMPENRTTQNLQRIVDLYSRGGELEKARARIPDWKALSPSAVQPWLVEAQLLNASGQTDESIKVLRIASRKFEDEESVATALATALEQSGQSAEATRLYHRFYDLAESPEDKKRWISILAQNAFTRGEIRQLTEKFQERQRARRDDPAPWLALAEIYRISQNGADYRKALTEASRLQPRNITLLHLVARAEEEGGQWESALSTLERAAPLDTTLRTRQQMASLHLTYGNETTGYRMLAELAGGAGMPTKDALRMADAMASRNDWTRLTDFITPIGKANPKDYRLAYFAALALEENGQNEAAAQAFLDLLKFKEELPEVIKLRAGIQPTLAFAHLTARTSVKAFPPGYDELNGLLSAGVYQSHYHLYVRRHNIRSSTGVIRPPDSVEQLPSMVALHLIMLAQSLAPDQADAFWQRAAAAGLGNTHLLRHLEIETSRFEVQVVEGGLEKSGWDPALLAYVTARMGRQQLDPAIARRAFDAFGLKYPEAALPAVIGTLATDPDLARPWLDVVIDSFEKSPGASWTSIFQISHLLGGGQAVQESNTVPNLTDAQKVRLRKLLSAMLQTREGQGTWLMDFVYVANSFLASGGGRELIALLDSEMEKSRTRPLQGGSQNFQNQFPFRSNGLVSPLEFPPAGPSLPPHIALWFQRKDIYNPRPEQDGEPDTTFEPLKPLLDQIKNPWLRLLVAYKADDAPRLEKELQSRLESPGVTQEDRIFAGALAQRKQDHARAARLFIQAMAEPVEGVLRPRLDAALVHSVISLTPPTPELTQAACQAVRRLRTGRVNVQEREELITAMTSLGMTEEATQWQRIAALVPAPAAVASNSSVSINAKKVQTLVAQGQQDAAIREAVKQLKGIFQAYYLSGNADYAQSESKKLLIHLKAKEATAQLMATLNPGETATTERQREYAGLLEMLAKPNESQEIYTRLLEKNPKDEQSRVRLMLLVAPTSPAKAAELLSQLPLKSLGQGFGGEITNLLSNSWDMDFTARMGLMDALSARLNQAVSETADKPALGAELEWALPLPSMLANTVNQSRNPLPYLHARTQERELDSNGGETPGQDSPRMIKLIQTHQTLCEAMMKHPILAETGFSWYACRRLAEQGDPKAIHEDLRKRAREILKAASSLPRPPVIPRSRYGYYREIASRWNPGPVEFLIWQAWKEGRQETIEQEIFPLAAKARGPASLSLSKLQASLWTQPAEQFAELAGRFSKVQLSDSISYGAQKNIIWLADRWLERNLPGPLLDDTVLAVQKASTASYTSYYYLPTFLNIRRQQAPESSIEDFLKRWLTATLGPQAGWKKRMDDWAANRFRSGGGSRDRQAYNLGQTLQNMLGQTGMLDTAIQVGNLVGLTSNEGWVQNNLYTIQSRASRNSTDALAYLEAIHAFADAANFMTLRGNPSRTNPLTQVTQELRKKPDLLAEVRNGVAKRQPRTFGLDLVEALLQENVQGALGGAIKKRAADFKLVPQERIAAVTALLKENLPALKSPETADPELIKALGPLLSVENASQIAEADRIMKASKLADLKMTDATFADQIPRLMKELLKGDPGMAKTLFLRGARMIEDKASSQGWEGEIWTGGWTYRSELVDDFNDATPGLPALILAIQLCHEDESGRLILDGKCNEGLWGATLLEVWKKAGGNARPAQATEELLVLLHKELGKTSTALFALGFYEFFAKLPEGVRLEVLQTASQKRQEPLRLLGEELAAAGLFYLTTDNASASNADLQKLIAALGGQGRAWDHYRKTVQDTQLNPRVRIAVAAHLCRKEIHRRDPALVRAAMALLAVEHRALHAVSGEYHFAPLAHAFCQLPISEEWNAEAKEQWEAWLVRNARNSESNRRNRAYDPREDASCAILGIVARLGHDEAITAVLTGSSESLEDDPSAFITLVANGAHQTALRWLETHWQTFLYNPNEGIEFTQSLANQLPAFIAAGAKSPDLALLGELVCITLEDPPQTTRWPGFADRNRRVMNLLPRISQTTFRDAQMHHRCLEHTAATYESYAVIQTEYDTATQKADVMQILELADTWKTFNRMKPVAASAAHRLWSQGDDTALVAMLKKLADVPSQGARADEIRAYTFSYLAMPVLEYLEWRWGKGEQGDLQKVAAYLDKVIAFAPRHEDCAALGSYILARLMLHAAEGTPEAYAQWQGQLTPEDARELKSLVVNRNSFYVCTGFFGKPLKRPLEERQKILSSMMADPWVQAKFPATGTGVPNMINMIVKTHKLLSLDELATHGQAFTAALPRKGRTAAEAADLLAQNGREDGLPFYDLAITAAGADVGLRANYLFRKTDLLERLGRKDEARKLLTDLGKETKLGAGPRRTLEANLKRLN